MKVTVFGSAAPKPGDPVYELAYHLGALLAKAGHTVINGGYIGTMEAVSKGAFEEGGKVIGATCEEIERWRNVAPNDYLTEEVRFATLKQRLGYLMDNCDAAVALPGGLGTLAEITLVWNEMAIEVKPKLPLILVGIGWKETFESFFMNMGMFVIEEDRVLLQFVPTAEDVIPILERYQQANGTALA